MRSKTRIGGSILVGLAIVTVLVVLTMGTGPGTPNSDPLSTDPITPTTTDSITPTTTETSQRYSLAYIYLERVGGEPEDYVELTEEELERFPALQTTIQMLESSGKKTIQYKTSEWGATDPWNYLEAKFQRQVSCEKICFWNYIFKYGAKYYSFRMMLP